MIQNFEEKNPTSINLNQFSSFFFKFQPIIITVKSAHAVTSIKQSPVLKGHHLVSTKYASFKIFTQQTKLVFLLLNIFSWSFKN